jgi:hypothetical protein
MAKYKMINPETGDKKVFKKGLSFTALFFSGFVAMSRDQQETTAMFAAKCGAWTLITMGFANIVFLFRFNKMFKKHLEKNGFVLEENVKVSI